MNINTNHIFRAFDRQIDSTNVWLHARVRNACGYTREVINDRLMQRLIEIGLQPFCLTVSALGKKTGNSFPASGERINCGRACLEIGSGRITLTAGHWLTNQLDFLLHWAYCLFAILNMTKTSQSNTPAVLVFGIGEESLFNAGNDEIFVRYCRLGPIEPLRSGKRFLVQSSSKNTSSDQSAFKYCRHALIRLLHESPIGVVGRLNLLTNHLIMFFKYIGSAICLPSLTLLARDFAYSSISFELDRRGLIESVLLTPAHPIQLLWMRALRSAKVHMIWYSQAAKQFVFADDDLDSPIPGYRWIRVDTHWVWTRAFSKYLCDQCPNQTVEVVGPIVWYMPELETPGNNKIKIAIFDVSPYSNDTAIAYGEIPNYNHPSNLLSFVENIVSLKPRLEELCHMPVTFSLKTKRGYNTAYDKAYFDFLDKLSLGGRISLKHHSTNVYSLISGSHLVIVYPFSSPAYIADFLKVPSIYYDPTAWLARHDFADSPSLIAFANTPETLFGAAASALSRVFAKEPLAH